MGPSLGSAADGRALGAAVVVLGLLVSAASALRAQTGTAGRLAFVEPHAGFADRYQFETVIWRFTLRNPGASPVRIIERIALDGTGLIEVEPPTVAPGGSAAVTVKQPLADRLGAISFRYALLTDEPGTPRYRFSLSGFAQSAFEPERPSFDFGHLDRSRGGSAEALLTSREVDRLQIVAVEEAPPFLQVTWSDASADGEQSQGLRATLTAGAPQGILAGTVRLRTNVATQPQVAIRYHAEVWGDVVPDQNPLPLGAIRLGETGVGVVRFTSRSGRAFEIAPARPEGASSPLRLAVRACPGVQNAAACRELEVRFTPFFAGPIGDRIELRVEGDDAPLPIFYTGLAIHPDTVIQPLALPESLRPPAAPEPRR